jgi:hypothetical protein
MPPSSAGKSFMPPLSTAGRWREALSRAARQTLAARWRGTLEALEAARREYRALRGSAAIDVRALRKAAQRVHDLEQLCAVLTHELGVPPTDARACRTGPTAPPLA